MIRKPLLNQLNVQRYEIIQIKSFSDESLKVTTRYIDSQSTKKCVLVSTAQIQLNCVVGHRNDYLVLQSANYDPFNAYDASTGIFTAPQDAQYEINVNLFMSASAAGQFGAFGQVNKQDITPQATQGTNYETLLSFINTAAAQSFLLEGSKILQLAKGDQFKIFIFSSVDNPLILFAGGNTAQVSFQWYGII